MTTRIAINGFGRIGRCIARALHQHHVDDLELVAINDLSDVETLAHLLRFDSVHGRLAHAVSAADDTLRIGDTAVLTRSVPDPRELDWGELGIDVVLECSGRFTDGGDAIGHVEAGATRVLISAPAKNHDKTVVYGVNHDEYVPREHKLISAGSCTTNCLAPIAKVIDDQFGIEHGLLTTVHSYTNDQHLLDLPHRKGDLRRARAAAANMIPSSTGAARAIAQVLPQLSGKLDGLAVRVPTIDVSLVDLTVQTRDSVDANVLHAAMRSAAETGPLATVLDYTELPLVSGDYIGCPASAVFDATLTRITGQTMAKVFAWYDNEWGFANRMIDLARLLGR